MVGRDDLWANILSHSIRLVVLRCDKRQRQPKAALMLRRRPLLNLRVVLIGWLSPRQKVSALRATSILLIWRDRSSNDENNVQVSFTSLILPTISTRRLRPSSKALQSPQARSPSLSSCLKRPSAFHHESSSSNPLRSWPTRPQSHHPPYAFSPTRQIPHQDTRLWYEFLRPSPNPGQIPTPAPATMDWRYRVLRHRNIHTNEHQENK